MKPDITVAILNYKRTVNVRRIIAGLRKQTRPCTIFVWDNSRTGRTLDDVDWQVRSSQNSFCFPRWFMLANAQTPFAMTLDDDLELARPDALEIVLGELSTLAHDTQIVGPEGVQLVPGAPYFAPRRGSVYRSPGSPESVGGWHLSAGDVDVEVDVVKGRSMAMSVSALKTLPLALASEDVCDDIAVSARLGRSMPRAHRVPRRFQGLFADLPGKDGPMALSASNQWRSIRNERCARYFAEGQP
jgi:hypothetical protein